MKETKIIVGENKLSDKEIEGLENFDKILAKHQQFTRKRKLMKGGLITAGVFVLGALLIYFLSQSGNEIHEERADESFIEQATTKPFDIELIRDTFLVNSELGGEFSYKNTKIIIPPNAFEDSNGTALTGDIILTYKEFHTAAEAFVAGIPMTYDSAETEFHFETAGMFEIRGFQNEKRILLSKSIEIHLASFNQENRFNQYFLDEVTGTWNYIQKDSIETNPIISLRDKKNAKEEFDKISRELNQLKNEVPVKKSNNSICVKLELDDKEFPEFASFKEVLFEVDNTDEARYKKMAETEYDDVKLNKNNDEFELHFYKKFKKTVVKVIPVYEGNAFEEALKTYDFKNGEKINKLKVKQKNLSETLNSVVNEEQYGSSPESFVTRIFIANRFGIFNSDCPQRMPRGQNLLVQYFNKLDKEFKDTLQLQSLYLVEENKTTLYTLRPNFTLSFNPNNKCALWGVTKDKKLVVLNAKDFLMIPKKSNLVCNLGFEVIDKNIFSEENVIKKLKIEALFESI